VTPESGVRRIAIAAGGTGGHVHPALAVADAYRVLVPGVAITFLGTAGGIEARLVPAHGYPFAAIPGAPLLGVGAAGKLRALAALARGTATARPVLRAARSELVLGLGGYASAGAILGARTLGLRTVIHEANAVAGVANRLLGRFTDRVLLGSPAAATAFSAAATDVTGVPVRTALADAAPRTRPTADAFRVLVVGGSGGSAFLNARVPDLLARLGAGGIAVAVHHQTGSGEIERVTAAYAGSGVAATVSAYIDDIGAAYRWADMAITCAGAGTLAELALVGLPALLVPLATAALDHQTANARAFAAQTGLPWSSENAWDAAALATRLRTLATSPDARAAAAAGVRTAARPDAAHAVVTACERLLAR
jgi:UDP-N-acetylglucosamine--N-acetylmuramyl-(pentapeptide) pyrophosphoryl-undecaprenol N-acetylglucosamine transferase